MKRHAGQKDYRQSGPVGSGFSYLFHKLVDKATHGSSTRDSRVAVTLPHTTGIDRIFRKAFYSELRYSLRQASYRLRRWRSRLSRCIPQRLRVACASESDGKADGVLNSEQWYAQAASRKEERNSQPSTPRSLLERSIDPACIQRLNRLLQRAGAVVIVSSSWRKKYQLSEIVSLIKARGFCGEVIGVTPSDEGTL